MSSILASDYEYFLYDVHRDDLYASGLSDDTIAMEGFQSIDDVNIVAADLGWEPYASLEHLGPFLRIPYRKQDGTPFNYNRYKPLYPRARKRDDGDVQLVKYEAPLGKSPPPYYPAGAIEALNTRGATLFFTEGEKKATKATQEGFPCIGLPGVSNWSKKRKENQSGNKIGKRRLNKWLRQIDWQGREVFIVFDADNTRNPDVNREAAELARALELHGATVHVLILPPHRDEVTGLYEKQGLDDYLVRHGRESLQRLIEEQTAESATICLDAFRREMQLRRGEISVPGLYMDSSPPGLGKSHHDTQVDLNNGKMLVLVPTHAQCTAAVAQFAEAGKEAVKYPQRSRDNCSNYSGIRRIESLGLDASRLICPKCPGKGTCAYHAACREAKKAGITIATHERFHQNGEKLARSRKYISVHEDLTGVFSKSVESDGFEQIVALAKWGTNGCWVTDTDDLDACKQLFVVAEYCRDALLQHDETMEISLPDLAAPVEKLDASLNHLITDFTRHLPSANWPPILRKPLNGTAFQFCRLLLDGCIDRLYVRHIRNENDSVVKKLVGIMHASFPADSVVILNDGTATLESIPPKFRDQIQDITPPEQAERLQEIVQYPVDITKSPSSLLRLVGSVRALLRLHPDKKRVGLLTHKQFLEVARGRRTVRELLTPEENDRIVKADWFRGTESRGSNSWKAECDLLIVAGTPRVPASAVQNRLLQLDNPTAAARDGQWATLDCWSGRRLDGKRETVRSRGYRDHDWHEAARQIVHAELLQAIGRARSVCPDGIPLTVVLSTEQLGHPLADDKLEVVNKRVAQNAAQVICHLLDCAGVLNSGTEGEQCPDGKNSPSSRASLLDGATGEITDNFAYRYLKQSCPLFSSSSDAVGRMCPTVKTGDLVPRMQMSERNIRRKLELLESVGLLTREGKRKGWYLTANNLRMFDQLPEYLFDEDVQSGSSPDHEHRPVQELLGKVMAKATSRDTSCGAAPKAIGPYV